ncbi:hypothetical protein DZC52_15180 [Wenzhouxiangella sediminis]|uniref:Type II toxin-antitoxin system RelE/ParE family toxin n=1 Tax=Wenzhouxiangella sediminis TaxID=1792836 RepID=A0A3E1K4U1_9GAMM|nr:hypothetical protein DZC52_15180 [Wenzhouxiangella sediminis]
MPRLRILQAAAEEAEAAIAWYESERRGLGADFAVCVERALDLLEDGLIPLLPLPGESGRVLERGEELIVVAFAHHSRKPRYWRARNKR